MQRAPSKAADADPSWAVELRVAGTWHRVWKGSLEDAKKSRPRVSVWPNPRGDRAMIILHYLQSSGGHGRVTSAWIEIPAGKAESKGE